MCLQEVSVKHDTIVFVFFATQTLSGETQAREKNLARTEMLLRACCIFFVQGSLDFNCTFGDGGAVTTGMVFSTLVGYDVVCAFFWVVVVQNSFELGE